MRWLPSSVCDRGGAVPELSPDFRRRVTSQTMAPTMAASSTTMRGLGRPPEPLLVSATVSGVATAVFSTAVVDGDVVAGVVAGAVAGQGAAGECERCLALER